MPNNCATIFNLNLESVEWLALATLIHVACVLLVTYRCLKVRREATSALLWIFLTWSFPILGAFLFLAFGVYRFSDKGWAKYESDQALLRERENLTGDEESGLITYWKTTQTQPVARLDDETAREIDRALDSICPDFPLVAGNSVKLLVTGDETYPALLETIENAKDHIHLQSFIIRPDKVGAMFMAKLAEKANSGVLVRVLFDRFGSTWGVWKGFFRKYAKSPNMHLAGWTQANVIKREFQINLRNHRKILVVDGNVAFTGGVNLCKENLSTAKRQADQDYHFKLTGPIVHELQYSFLRDWHFMSSEKPVNLLARRYFPAMATTGSSYARLLSSGPTLSEMEAVANAFFTAIVAAEESIVAVTPYFVPTRDILQALRSAALRGVEVKIVVPQKNNHLYTGLASRSMYEELLHVGVEIYERHPPFMHAKALVIDDSVAIVGSANLDVRSLRLNYETNIVIYDPAVTYEIRQACRFEIENSTQITLNKWLERPVHRQLTENLFALFTPIL